MWGFQLWVNLPAKDKMTAPRYQDIQPDRIPETSPAQGVHVRVLAGRVGDVIGPVSGIAVEPVYFDISLEPNARFAAPLPQGHNAFAYVYDGAADIGDADSARRIERGELAVLDRSGGDVLLSADAAATRLILVAGKPLNEPVAKYGPFVMNTQEQIVEAIQDFQSGRF